MPFVVVLKLASDVVTVRAPVSSHAKNQILAGARLVQVGRKTVQVIGHAAVREDSARVIKFVSNVWQV